jgi:uncharacterized protein (DUF4415 family)
MPRKKSAGARTSGEWIDPDDAPELTDEHFTRADLYEGETLVRRGRPKSEAPKQQVTLRLSQDVLAHFRATGAGWQSRIDAELLKAVRRARKGEDRKKAG